MVMQQKVQPANFICPETGEVELNHHLISRKIGDITEQYCLWCSLNLEELILALEDRGILVAPPTS